MFKKRLILLFLSSVLVFLGLSTYLVFKSFSPIFAAPTTYNPSFDLSVVNLDAGVTSDVIFTVNNSLGSKKTQTQIYNIPAGWQITSSPSMPEGLAIGGGTFGVTLPIIGTISLPFSLTNSQIDLGSHKDQIVVKLGPLKFNVFIDGDNSTGHTIRVDRSANIDVNIGPPTTLTVKFFGDASGTTFLANPTSKGLQSWSVEFRSVDGDVVTRSSRVNIR